MGSSQQADSSTCEVQNESSGTRVGSATRELLINLFIPVHLPNLCDSICGSCLFVVIPIFMRQTLHASSSSVGLVLGAMGVGRILVDLPGGSITEHCGVRRVSIAGLGLYCVALVLGSTVQTDAQLVIITVIIGCSIGLFYLARHRFLVDAVPKDRRGRLMALVGGMYRLGIVPGSALGGLLLQVFSARTAFLSQVPLIAAALCCMNFSAAVKKCDAAMMTANAGRDKQSIKSHVQELCATVRIHFGIMFRIGIFSMSLVGLRTCRRMFLPLAAMNLNMEPAEAGVLVSTSYLVDSCLFFVGGIVSDRFGRKATAIPTAFLMGVAFVLLAFTFSVPMLFFVAIFFGLSDGVLSSGILLSLIGDHMPRGCGATQYIGAMRFLQDSGMFVSPLLGGLLVDLLSFQTACFIIGCGGAFTGLWAFWMLPVEARSNDNSNNANSLRCAEEAPRLYRIDVDLSEATSSHDGAEIKQKHSKEAA